jgi:hypothetical protein
MNRGLTQEGLFQFNLQYRYQLEGSQNDEILVHYSDPDAFKSSDIYILKKNDKYRYRKKRKKMWKSSVFFHSPDWTSYKSDPITSSEKIHIVCIAFYIATQLVSKLI